MKIAIAARKEYSANYKNYLKNHGFIPVSTLKVSSLSHCDGLILPGGGDINPVFFGEKNTFSKNIDTELDILQFNLLEYAVKTHMPVLGICKGMQLINVFFGGTIHQNMAASSLHEYIGHDQFHSTTILEKSFLYELYGPDLLVNSAHHQSINRMGDGLLPIQWSEDGAIEGFSHVFLPIWGVQWHPERIPNDSGYFDSGSILSIFKKRETLPLQ